MYTRHLRRLEKPLRPYEAVQGRRVVWCFYAVNPNDARAVWAALCTSRRVPPGIKPGSHVRAWRPKTRRMCA